MIIYFLFNILYLLTSKGLTTIGSDDYEGTSGKVVLFGCYNYIGFGYYALKFWSKF